MQLPNCPSRVNNSYGLSHDRSSDGRSTHSDESRNERYGKQTYLEDALIELKKRNILP